MQNPCLVTNGALAETGEGTFYPFSNQLNEPVDESRRLTSQEATCDKNEYRDALRVLLSELSENDFRDLFREIVWERSSIEHEFG